MKQLWYNPETKVVFGSEDMQAAPIEAISNVAVPDLIANGATVDESANDAGKSDSSDSALDSTTGTANDSNEKLGSSADLPNDHASDALDQSAASTSGSAPAASGASVEAVSPADLAALHPGTTAKVSYSIPESAGEPEKEAQRQADSAAIVGAGNMHLNSHVTDATGTTGTKDGQPVLSNATDGYTATLKPAPTNTLATSDHPAHGMLDLLWKELEGNSFAGRARELILKIRDTL
jgi:hypothetical protein